MAIRRSVRALSEDEKQAFTDAVWALKKETLTIDGFSTYDRYVVWHARAMNHATPWSEDGFLTARNSAHRGPTFFPWHREFLRRFELDLQRVSGNVDLGLPFWDWELDGNLPVGEQPTAPVWNLIGGDGDSANVGIVVDGPFAFDLAQLSNPNFLSNPNNWITVGANGRRSGLLQRRLGQNPQVPALPDKEAFDSAVDDPSDYDVAPWDEGVEGAFRNIGEGWLPFGLHNQVHVWVGGSMGPATSPNDPVFFLHHSNVDRMWALWQAEHDDSGYIPEARGPMGHNLNDYMYPWDGRAVPSFATPADTLDLGDVEYEEVGIV